MRRPAEAGAPRGAPATVRSTRLTCRLLSAADTYHTSRFLVFWLIFLPFTLYTELGWGALPVAPIMTFLIFGVVRARIGALGSDRCAAALRTAQGARVGSIRERYCTAFRQAEIAIDLEEPFSILPLDALCDMARTQNRESPLTALHAQSC